MESKIWELLLSGGTGLVVTGYVAWELWKDNRELRKINDLMQKVFTKKHDQLQKTFTEKVEDLKEAARLRGEERYRQLLLKLDQASEEKH